MPVLFNSHINITTKETILYFMQILEDNAHYMSLTLNSHGFIE